jgi:hypothetical protein
VNKLSRNVKKSGLRVRRGVTFIEYGILFAISIAILMVIIGGFGAFSHSNAHTQAASGSGGLSGLNVTIALTCLLVVVVGGLLTWSVLKIRKSKKANRYFS